MRIRTIRSITVGAAALAAVLAFGGCSISLGSSDHGDGHMMDSSESGAAMSADAMFAQMMIPHHEQAVEMSTLAESRAADPEIKALAAEIRAAQQPEIDQMKAWLEEWGVPVMSGMDAMGEHGGHGMSGMLTDEQMSELEATSGPEFDRLFAEYMILHHEGAIDMAEDVAGSADPRVAALAKAIIETQQAEIAEMETFLQQQEASSVQPSASPAAAEGDASASPSVVDLAEPFDHMHAVTLANGELLVGTHTGVVQVDPITGSVKPRGTAHDDFMSLTASGDDLIASGHPGHGSSLPDPLGLIRSTDGGLTWTTVSLTGEVDFHALASDGDQIIGQGTAGDLLYSSDGGSSWEAVAQANATSLAWFADRAWIADGTSLMAWSVDGQTAESDLGPAVFLATAADGSALWAVLIDGTVHRSVDGASWSMVGSVPEATYLAATSDRAYLVSPSKVYVVPAA